MNDKVRKIHLYNLNSRINKESNKLNSSDEKLCKSDYFLNKPKVTVNSKNKFLSNMNQNMGKLKSDIQKNEISKKNSNFIHINQPKEILNSKTSCFSQFGQSPTVSNKRHPSSDNKLGKNTYFSSSNTVINNTSKITNKLYEPDTFKNLLNKIMRANTDNLIETFNTNIDKNLKDDSQNIYINTNNNDNNIVYNSAETDSNRFTKGNKKRKTQTGSTYTLNSGNKISPSSTNLDFDGTSWIFQGNNKETGSFVNHLKKHRGHNKSVLSQPRINYKISTSTIDKIGDLQDLKNKNKSGTKDPPDKIQRKDFCYSTIENFKNAPIVSPNNKNQLIKCEQFANQPSTQSQSIRTNPNQEVSKNCRELLKIISKYKLLTVKKFSESLLIPPDRTKINCLTEELHSLKKETLDLYYKLKDISSVESSYTMDNNNLSAINTKIDKPLEDQSQSRNFNLKIIDISSERRMTFYKNCFDLCKEGLTELKNELLKSQQESIIETKNFTNVIENNIIINNNENCGNNLNFNLNLNLNSINSNKPPKTFSKKANVKNLRINLIKKITKKKLSRTKFRIDSYDESVNLSDSMMSEGIKVKLPHFDFSVNKPKEQNLKFKKLAKRITYKRLKLDFNKNSKIEKIPDSNSISENFDCNSLNETIILKENHNNFKKKFELKENLKMRSKSVLEIEIKNFVIKQKKSKSKEKDKFLMDDDSVVKISDEELNSSSMSGDNF